MKRIAYPIVLFSFILIAANIQDFLAIEGDGYIMGQFGVGTDQPEGALDIVSEDMGLVLPRVKDVFAVSDGASGPPVDGTVVYDSTRESMMFRINQCWVGMTVGEEGQIAFEPSMDAATAGNYTYFKSSNTDAGDDFGLSISLSDDGSTFAVGARNEASNSAGINGNEADNSIPSAGAVYVFFNDNGVWSQQAYLKASAPGEGDQFGFVVSLSSDGNTLAVGARNEDSNATGINGNDADNTASNSGAAYVFTRSGTTWSQQAYVKASNTDAGDFFGYSLSLSDNGNVLAIGARGERSSATGVGGDQNDDSRPNAGAAYIFTRSGTTWSQHSYIKASNSETGDLFGARLALSGDGQTLCVTAYFEDSNATGVNGDQNDNTAISSGAAYIFTESADVWSQVAYIKASNTDPDDRFGQSLVLNQDGTTLAIGTWYEDSNSTGVNGIETDNSAIESGAVYVYSYDGSNWSQQAYIKTSNTEADDRLGRSVAMSNDGNVLVSGAYYEDGGTSGADMDQNNNSAHNSGAIYVFQRFVNQWSQVQYIKASNTDTVDLFGISCAIDMNGKIAVGASIEDSNATGINGNQNDNTAVDSGAAYLIE